MKLINVSSALIKAINIVVDRLFWIGAAALLLMMFVTFTDVVMRYGLNQPIIGAYEITEALMSVCVSFALVYCGIKKGHIIIDWPFLRLPKNLELNMDRVTSFIGLVLFSIITWQSALLVKYDFDKGIGSWVLIYPIFYFVAAVTLGLGLFAMVLLTYFVENAPKEEN